MLLLSPRPESWTTGPLAPNRCQGQRVWPKPSINTRVTSRQPTRHTLSVNRSRFLLCSPRAIDGTPMISGGLLTMRARRAWKQARHPAGMDRGSAESHADVCRGLPSLRDMVVIITDEISSVQQCPSEAPWSLALAGGAAQSLESRVPVRCGYRNGACRTGCLAALPSPMLHRYRAVCLSSPRCVTPIP